MHKVIPLPLLPPLWHACRPLDHELVISICINIRPNHQHTQRRCVSEMKSATNLIMYDPDHQSCTPAHITCAPSCDFEDNTIAAQHAWWPNLMHLAMYRVLWRVNGECSWTSLQLLTLPRFYKELYILFLISTFTLTQWCLCPSQTLWHVMGQTIR